MATINTIVEELQGAQGAICDMVSAFDFDQKIKGNAGLIITSTICDIGGNSIFSYDTVMKYYKDENGKEHITAEIAGKIVEDIIFDAGIKQTVKNTLAVSGVAFYESNPIAAGGVAVATFITGYAVTKTVSKTAGVLTTKIFKELSIGETMEIKSSENNITIFEHNPKTNTTTLSEDKEVQKNIIPTLQNIGVNKVSIDNQTYKIENGNTVWDIAQKNNTTVDELIKLNPWLKDNMSDDKSWILIKPGQTIELPQSDEQRSIDSGLEYNPQQAQQIIIDPLVLDLNHNGKIDTINANSSNTFFDMDSNGMSEITGWIDKEDGLLVYDKNNNGKIDNINELFGNKNKDGYRELRELINSNDDNVIDKNDTKFKDLKIWQDLNGDGISQNNELKTLDELNITSINLNSKNTNIDDNGNNIFKTSTFTQNGQEYLSGDVNFAVDKRFTDFRGDYSLSVDALFLPWLRGYGDVKDAHIAYSMDEERKVA